MQQHPVSRCFKVNFYLLYSEMHRTPTSGLIVRRIFLYFPYVLMFDKTAYVSSKNRARGHFVISVIKG